MIPSGSSAASRDKQNRATAFPSGAAPVATPDPKKDRPPITWTLREASEEDRDRILACREITFEGEELEKQTPAYWQWEFVDNYAGPARLFVAEDGDKVVGGYAVIPQRFMLGGKQLKGSIVVDVMTHPDYRYQGMFTKLGRFSIDHCTQDPAFEFTTGYPIRPEVVPGHLKVGWRIRFKIGTYVMPLAFGAIVKAQIPWTGKVPGLATLLGAIPGALLGIWASLRLAGGAHLEVKRQQTCDETKHLAFWEKLRPQIPGDCLIQERKPDFLRWRYDDNPGRNYTYHVAEDASGAMQGYVVSRVSELLDVKTMIVVDAVVLPSASVPVLRKLLSDVRALAKEQACAMLATMVTQPSPMFCAPSKLGLIPTPYKFTLITRELAKETVMQDDELDWHLMWGDTDDV